MLVVLHVGTCNHAATIAVILAAPAGGLKQTTIGCYNYKYKNDSVEIKRMLKWNPSLSFLLFHLSRMRKHTDVLGPL